MIFKAGFMFLSILPKVNFHGKAWKDKVKNKNTKKSCKKSLQFQFHIWLNLYQSSFKISYPTLEVYISIQNQIINFYLINLFQSLTITCLTYKIKILTGFVLLNNVHEKVINRELKNKDKLNNWCNRDKKNKEEGQEKMFSNQANRPFKLKKNHWIPAIRKLWKNWEKCNSNHDFVSVLFWY